MIVGSAKRESIEKTVCLSCVKEGYHAPRQGFLKGIALEATGHEEGERGGYGKGGWAVRRREREREKALKPGREELRVGAGKKREGSRGGGRARLRRKTGKGEGAWLGIAEGMRECLQGKKTTGRLTKTARWK